VLRVLVKTSSRLSPAWFAGFLLVVVLQGCGSVNLSSFNPLASKTLTHGELVREPKLAGLFIEAYLRGDEAAVEQVASPLYRQEWARRGISVEQRQRWMPTRQPRPDGASGVFTLSFVDGLVSDDNLSHLLYLARSGDASSKSVWRVDADSSGRVIWIEMVWLFSSETTSLINVSTPREAGLAALPQRLARINPDMLIGVRDSVGWEGYYAARYIANGGFVVNFFGLDEYGDLRYGVWSYRERRATG
jgi:hypothetical protein